MGNEFDWVERCSFCGNTRKQIAFLISLTKCDNFSVNICSECILICNEVLFAELRKFPLATDSLGAAG